MISSSKTYGRILGDLKKEELLSRMVRVNHAGEYGAKRIYQGQLAVLGKTADAEVLREMAVAEERHLKAFEKLVVKRKVRPTLLMPFWNVAGFALGAATALAGREAAMACTVAIEEVIEEHYAEQSAQLENFSNKNAESELKEMIDEFRIEEIEHKHTALDNDAENAPGYFFLSSAVKAGSRIAIWLSERL